MSYMSGTKLFVSLKSPGVIHEVVPITVCLLFCGEGLTLCFWGVNMRLCSSMRHGGEKRLRTCVSSQARVRTSKRVHVCQRGLRELHLVLFNES